MELQPNFPSIQQVANQYLGLQTERKDLQKGQGSSFEEILRQKQKEQVGELKFSKHAGQRLSQRDISLTENQRKRLEDGTGKAREKGMKESLVMVDGLAFIVNVKSNTVVTALSLKDSSMGSDEAVFTNIDGAVII